MPPAPLPLVLPLLLALIYHQDCAGGQLLQTNSVHRTPAAERPVNDLWCYRCQTMDSNDRCANPRSNHTILTYKCKDDKRLCMVKRFSYTTSNENSTSTEKMWSLERNCTKHCEPGCIVIGERTKIYACTSCCNSALCNNGTGRATTHRRVGPLALLQLLLCLTATAAHTQPINVFGDFL
ncbi:uncharacterized protein LOC143919029 [Arctopsyche grandis]|uniref:uncharacterized protein LOC143919029 n=1 Tax=Arctopsyche grandis TaxID=121162 RepID=UPI00406D65BC